MNQTKTYSGVLSEALEVAATHLQEGNTDDQLVNQYPALRETTYMQNDREVVPLADVASSVNVITGNLDQNKYLFSILATAVSTKIVHPAIDIRNYQSNMASSYSNRSTDDSHVTPFLKRNGLTHCAASGMESGRNFERPTPLTLNFPSKPRGKGNREAVLGLLHAVQVDGVDPLPVLIYLFYKDLSLKKSVLHEYPAPQGLTVQQIIDAIVNHFDRAQGQGKSRLPVLAV